MNRANRWISVSLAAAGYFATLVAGHGVAAQDANRAVAEPRIRVAQQQTPPKQNTPIAQAQPAAPPPPTVPAWAVSCSDREQGKLLCEMTQNVVERTSGSQVALFSVKGTSDGGATAMLIRLFHGIYIPAGASIRIDEGSPTKAV